MFFTYCKQISYESWCTSDQDYIRAHSITETHGFIKRFTPSNEIRVSIEIKELAKGKKHQKATAIHINIVYEHKPKSIVYEIEVIKDFIKLTDIMSSMTLNPQSAVSQL